MSLGRLWAPHLLPRILQVMPTLLGLEPRLKVQHVTGLKCTAMVCPIEKPLAFAGAMTTLDQCWDLTARYVAGTVAAHEGLTCS
jgi:hypothetical protein